VFPHAERRDQSLRKAVGMFWTLVLCIAVTHWIVFTSALATTIVLGESRPSGFSATLATVVVWTLGTPIMHLLRLPPTAFGSSRWWDDDANLILGLAGINAFGWGIAFASIWSRSRRRRGVPEK
jgi:hypothetical protein